MTAPTYGKATTADQFHLLFDSVEVGNWVETFKAEWSHGSPVAVRHNLWASSVLLDGSYPALVWKNSFVLYLEKTNRRNFIQAFIDVSTLVVNLPKSLKLARNVLTGTIWANTTYVDYGNCYLDASGLKEPADLLLHSAGFITLEFYGSTKPVSYDVGE